jgi:hypothetical protein
MTWKCAECNEKIDDDFDACWQCSTARDGTAPNTATSSVCEAVLPNGLQLSEVLSLEKDASKSKIVLALIRRYRDAYTSARWQIWLGTLVKFAAVFLGVVSVGAGLMLSALSPYAMWISFAIGSIISIPIYVMGVLTSAQGQTSLATLDTAVNTSRHLSDDDVAELIL